MKRFQRSCQSSAVSLVEISTSASPAAAFRSGRLGQLAGRAVDGVLDRVLADLRLLDAGGRQLEQLGQDELGLLAPNADGEADHAAWLPSARRSLANIDSSERRFSSVSVSVQLLQQLALLVAQAARNDDVDDHAQVPAPTATERGHALAPQRQHLARLRARRQLDRRRALERGHLERRRRAPPAARARRAP